jgi:hypothetical protein
MCAGRATHQPTSNGGENIACRNKGFEASANAVCSKNKPPRRGTGVGDGPTRRQQQHRLHEVRIESFRCWLSRARRIERYMYLMESTSYVERPSAFWASGGKIKKRSELCCCCSPPRRIPRHRPTQKERARSPGPTCRSANVKRGVEPELANRSHFREHTSYIPS